MCSSVCFCCEFSTLITSCPSVMTYEQSAAERVKAKMKLQLAETGKYSLVSTGVYLELCKIITISC